jgi:hypothetical protein
MKTLLRYLLVVALPGLLIQQANAQCTADDILVQNIVPNATQTPGTCTAKFDLSFTMENNNGNKFIFLHAWSALTYPDFFDCVNGQPSSNGTIQPPEGSDLANAFINLGIDNSGTSPSLLPVYTPDNSVTLNSADSVTKTILANGLAFYVIYGITATFPVPCDAPFLMKVDFWSSQSASAQVAHCVSCGLTYAINFIDVNGLANCATLTYNASIVNQQALALTGNYLVYADVNGDGFLSTSVDALVTDTTTFNLAAGVGSNTAISGSIPAANINQDLLIVTNLSIGGTAVFLIPTTVCAPLPVTFMSFTATRSSRSNVILRWTTANEINNSGFAVQRNMGVSGVWETIGFIPTQAPAGNSSTPLTYTFNDLNSARGITQYRLRQVDFDGRFKYSEIRAVRGYEQKGRIIVYPNPSAGKVNVVFDDFEGTRDVVLIDMSGRAIRQWKGLTGNNLQIENLGKGMYSLKITVRETGQQNVEKIVVKDTRIE